MLSLGKKFFRLVLAIIFIYSLVTTLSGQLPHFRAHPLPIVFENSQPSVLLEASNGLIWVGTNNGLFQYNGLNFHPVRYADSLTTFQVSALYEDTNHRIWIGTKSGDIFIYESSKGMHQWMPEEGTPAVAITGFTQTVDSTLWIGTYGEGVYYWKEQRMYNIGPEEGLFAQDIYHLATFQKNQILAASDAGVYVCQIHNKLKEVQTLDRDVGLSDEITKVTLSDHKGGFYVGTYGKGIDHWSVEEQRFNNLTPTWDLGEINTLEWGNNNRLWIGTNGNGLYRLNISTGRLDTIRTGDSQKCKILDLHQDVEGNIWIINNKIGIQTTNLRFAQLNHQKGNTQALLIDHRGIIWIGTPEGLYYFQEGKFCSFDFGKSLNVISLFIDHYGFLWVGTFGQGLYCIDITNDRYRLISTADGLQNDNVLSIDGCDEKIWLATLGGVFEIKTSKSILQDPIRLKNYTLEDGLGTNFIYKVYVDKKNRTWFGTDGKGLAVLWENQIKNYPTIDGAAIKAVYSITEDKRGHIWMSTAEMGVVEYDGNQFHPLQNISKRNPDLIASLITDVNGNILLSHQDGIDILDPADGQILAFDEELALDQIEPALNALYHEPGGNILIGANNQIIRYSAPSKKPVSVPRTLLRQVKIFFEPVNFSSKNSFQADQNSLILEYEGLWYTAPEKVSYRYQLEGYDQGWIYSKDQQATYSSLPPGDYRFRVSASVSDNFSTTEEAVYAFHIAKPFWQTWWFIGTLAALILLLTYRWIKWQTGSVERKAQLQRERIESQLEVLKSQINPHFLFNSFNTLLSLIEEDRESAGAYVEHLSDFYRSLLAYRQKDLIPLQEELELLNNFEFLLKKRFKNNLQLTLPSANGRAVFIPPLTLQMLVENAIKHNIVSRTKPLNIRIEIKEASIEVINNLQAKLTKEKSTHFGLESIRSRYALLNYPEVIIEETEKYFRVSLPIIKKA